MGILEDLEDSNPLITGGYPFGDFSRDNIKAEAMSVEDHQDNLINEMSSLSANLDMSAAIE